MDMWSHYLVHVTLIKKKKRIQVLHFKQVVISYRKIYKIKYVETMSVCNKYLMIKGNLIYVIYPMCDFY